MCIIRDRRMDYMENLREGKTALYFSLPFSLVSASFADSHLLIETISFHTLILNKQTPKTPGTLELNKCALSLNSCYFHEPPRLDWSESIFVPFTLDVVQLEIFRNKFSILFFPHFEHKNRLQKSVDFRNFSYEFFQRDAAFSS